MCTFELQFESENPSFRRRKADALLRDGEGWLQSLIVYVQVL